MDNQYTRDELGKLGFAALGERVEIDRSCRILGSEYIRIGSDVRIDAFCVLSAGQAGITLGNHVHLAVGVTLLGQGAIVIEDFCGLSARVSVFSSNDDYSGGAMTNPTVPDEFRNVTSAPVIMRRHSLAGSGSVIMPGVTLGMGAAVGALTVVRKTVSDFAIVVGNPAREVGQRGRKMLEYEIQLRASSH